MGHYRLATDSWCNGKMEWWRIKEHNYSFNRCDTCGNYSGYMTKQTVDRLMQIKVRPTLRRM